MSADAPGRNGPWPVLDIMERRILGVMIEKAKTTPDAYPMSVNALVTGSNQKSNRDPVMELDDTDVESTLNRLKNRGLVVRVTGSRVDRWRHLLYEQWHLDRHDVSIVGELLLRGPQTEGELRTRASRMDPIEDLETLRGFLRPLSERGLVVYLSPEERRGTTLTHGFHDRAELEALLAGAASAPEPAARATPTAAVIQAPKADERVPALVDAVAALTRRVEALEAALRETRATSDAVRREMQELRQALGG